MPSCRVSTPRILAGPGQFAFVLLLSRLFDAVTDPLIGYWSDRYCARGGSRKPFIICGGILFILSGYFLYVPPDDVSVYYFCFWYLAFVFSATLFEIPHLAWGNDLASSAEKKSSLYGWRAFMGSVGLMAFFILPLLPVFESKAITPETLRWSVYVAGGLLIILLTISIQRLPAGRPASGSHSEGTGRQKESLLNLWRAVKDNRPLKLFFAAFIGCGFGAGMCMTLLFLFIDAYLGMGEHFAWLYVVSHIFSISSVALWTRLSIRWSKQTVWLIAMVLLGIAMLGLGIQAPGANLNQLLIVLTFLYCGFAAWMVVAPALLSDIADYSSWKFGRDRSGTYFALYQLVNKANIALGGAVGMALAGWYGFDATATDHSADTAFGLYLGIAWLPLPFLLLSALCMVAMPITAARHKLIQRRLKNQTLQTI